jgi:integrase
MFSALSAFLSWYVSRSELRNPMEGMRAPPKPAPRERLLTNEELSAIWRAAAEIGFPYGTIVQLLLATGQRRNQIASLRRSWIEAHAVSYPGSVMKSGKPLTVPLGPLSRHLLDQCPSVGDLMVPGSGTDAPFAGWSKSAARLVARSGVGHRLHDYRRFFASTLASQGTALHVCEKLIGHRSGSFAGVVGVYQRHSFMAEQREAVHRYELFLGGLVGHKLPLLCHSAGQISMAGTTDKS